MKSRPLSIILNGKRLSTSVGTRISDILEQSPHRGGFTPLGVIVNGRLDGLYYELKSDADIETIDLSMREGMDIYRRTAIVILCSAMRDIDPHARLTVGQSVMDSYFFEIHNHPVSNELISHLEKRMWEIVKSSIPLKRNWTIIEEAIQTFEQEGQSDKVMLLNQYRRSEVPLIKIENHHGIAYGPVADTTSKINAFKLVPYEHGMVLVFPDSHGNVPAGLPPQPKLFGTYIETKRWNELVAASNIAQLNEHCVKGTISDLVKVAEALHEKKIAAIADDIAARKNVRLILIAGPSGSGKTTFTKRLAIQLKLHGISPVSLSLDSYYVDRDKTPKHPDGSYNFECLEALDVKLFNDHLKRLLSGEEVKTPCYNFPLGRRDPGRCNLMKLGKHEILITEGIHGLNDSLSQAINRENKFKIYVSALTQLSLDDHNRVFTSDVRLLRRIVRDRLFRGSSAAETIRIWPSVRKGEGEYIFPFQENADVIFNSALVYEQALLKPFIERYLAEVPRGHPSIMQANRLLRFMAFIIPILPGEAPHTSILREFIGGSAFRYT